MQAIKFIEFKLIMEDDFRRVYHRDLPGLPYSREYELEIVKRIISIEKKLDYLIKKVEELEKLIRK